MSDWQLCHQCGGSGWRVLGPAMQRTLDRMRKRDDWYTASQLAHDLGVGITAMHMRLAVLRDAGLVERKLVPGTRRRWRWRAR